MKILRLLLLITLLTGNSLLQGQDTKSNRVSFITKIEAKNTTKDGIYLNGYVVEISNERLTELIGKKVRITGKVTIVKGLKHYNDSIIRQGRQEDSKHILNPTIKIIKE